MHDAAICLRYDAFFLAQATLFRFWLHKNQLCSDCFSVSFFDGLFRSRYRALSPALDEWLGAGTKLSKSSPSLVQLDLSSQAAALTSFIIARVLFWCLPAPVLYVLQVRLPTRQLICVVNLVSNLFLIASSLLVEMPFVTSSFLLL